jgi:hypothetical protein
MIPPDCKAERSGMVAIGWMFYGVSNVVLKYRGVCKMGSIGSPQFLRACLAAVHRLHGS